MNGKVIPIIEYYIQLAVAIRLEQGIAMMPLTQCCPLDDHGITNIARLPFC